MAAVQTGHGGDRRLTMADVAAAAGVSTALVSIVMREAPGASDATRERVRQVADDLGYVPDRRAQKLRQSRSRLIGVTFEVQQPFHGDLVERLYPAAAAHGYDLALSCVAPSRDEHAAIGDLIRDRCEAAILLGSRMRAPDLAALAARMPTQVVARPSGTDLVGSVRTDDTAGIVAAVDHLVTLGHRRILHITGGDAPGSAERVTGFTTRMATHGLAQGARVVAGGPTETDGARAITEGLEHGEQPTGVIAFNDRCAIGVLDLLLRRGIRAPDHISVLGYDDSRLSQLTHISLSTIAQDADRIADEVVTNLARQIAGGPTSETILSPRLIPRDTTGPAPS